MSAKEAYRIGNLEKIDAAFVMPFLTGIYPSFYNWKLKKKFNLQKKRQSDQWNNHIKLLEI